MVSKALREKLKQIGLAMPQVSEPGGNYQSVNIRGQIAYIAIQFPIYNGAFLHQGVLGDSIDLEAGRQAMQLCALNSIAQIDQKVGWQNVAGVNHLDMIMDCVAGWPLMPKVADGASDLFLSLFDERGWHSRSISSAKLPAGFCAGLTCSVTLNHLPTKHTLL